MNWPLLRKGRAVRRLTLVLFALTVAIVAAQDPTQALPVDPAVRTGTLANGLTYFIRRNSIPEKRAFLYLAVKAGSIDEADDQRGLAHVVEHMAFNGSANFKPGELIAYFESMGVRLGPHINASTGYDQTVYRIDVPVDREDAFARALDALGDFAGRTTFDAQEVERERGVVVEEWRGRLGAASRIEEPRLAALFGQSKYAVRRPIGTSDSLQTFSLARLRDFYRDHYRPDRMAVVVVGDIEPIATEALVRSQFLDQPRGPDAARPVNPVPRHDDTRYVSLSDPEAQGSTVAIVQKRPLAPPRTIGEYRRGLVAALMFRMVNVRLATVSREPDAPFVGAGTSATVLGGATEIVTTSASVVQGSLTPALQRLATELARVTRFGFDDAEVERAKRDILATYDRFRADSGGFADRILGHYLFGQPLIPVQVEPAIVRSQLPWISSADIHGLAREVFAESNRVVVAASPARAGVTSPTAEALQVALTAGASAPVTPWKDSGGATTLMATPPVPGTVRARREIPEIGVTVLTLSNGVEVWLKPMSGPDFRVEFVSYALGGAGLAATDDFFGALSSAAFVSVAGAGGLTPVDISRIVATRVATVTPAMNASTHGVSGTTSVRDLETALQLTHLYFTSPNPDRSTFERLKATLASTVASAAEDPGRVFGVRRQQLNTLNHPRTRVATPETVARLDAIRIYSYFRERFANAANFTFFFAGGFTEQAITPLLGTYLGSLPSTGTADARLGGDWFQFPPTVVREVFKKGREPRSQTAITFFADTRSDEKQILTVRTAAAVLQVRLRELLREQLGATYTVTVDYSDTAPQPGYGTVAVQFACAPANAERLTDATLAAVESLRTNGPRAEELQSVKEAMRAQLKSSLGQSTFWAQSLQAMHMAGRDPRTILARDGSIAAVGVDEVTAAFRTYFPRDRYTVLTMLPEE